MPRSRRGETAALLPVSYRDHWRTTRTAPRHLAASCVVFSCLRASKPLSLGMEMSMTMTSGRSRLAESRRRAPSATEPTTSKRPWRSRLIPSVNTTGSSASITVGRRISSLFHDQQDCRVERRRTAPAHKLLSEYCQNSNVLPCSRRACVAVLVRTPPFQLFDDSNVPRTRKNTRSGGSDAQRVSRTAQSAIRVLQARYACAPCSSA